MSSPPTFYKQLNTFRLSKSLAWSLMLGFVTTLLYRRQSRQGAGIIWEIVFAFSLLCAELIFYCCTIIVYRIWFHPLAKYPGPFLAKFTDWYSVYHCFREDRHIDFYKLHCQYGSIVRYGPHRICVNTNTALRDIYHVRSNCQKSQFFTVFSHFFKVQMVMTTIDHKEHGFKRRIAAKALTASAMKKMEAGIMKNVRIFCDKMLDDADHVSRKWNSARNMSQWCGWLVNDIMGDITFHRNWSMLTNEENRDVLEVLSRGVGGLNMMGHMPTILSLKLDKIFFRGATEGTYKYERLTAAQTNWRMQQGDKIDECDIFGSLMVAHDAETNRGLTREELIAEAGLFIIAGSDTTASAITATIFYLLYNEECLNRVQKEVLNVFASLEDIHSGEKLTGCQYLHACITEAMRLSPGVGGILPREVLQPGMHVDGHYFPAGTDIGVANYAIHHSEDYFPNPFTFRPTRWLLASEYDGGVSAEEVKLASLAYAPFSVGRASCLGQTLAYQEMMTVIARLIYMYEMRIQPGSTLGEGSYALGASRSRTGEFQTWDRFISHHEGPMVEFRPRDRGDMNKCSEKRGGIE